MTVIPIPGSASRLNVKERTVLDSRWRRRVNLPVVRVGQRIVGCFEQDLEAVLRAGREQLVGEEQEAS